MRNLAVIYRSCPSELNSHKPGRPSFFDKEKCYKSLYNNFAHSSDLFVIWDGDKDNRFYELIESTKNSVNIICIDVKDNKKSLESCYQLAEKIDHEYLAFIEDDFLWKEGSCKFLIDALKLGYDPITLYDHPDRYLPDQRRLYVGGTDSTSGNEYIGLTNFGYVRTCESTTCTFSCSKEFFDLTKEDLHYFNNIGHGAPEDRKYWVRVREKYNIRLWSAIPGLACHMQLPLTHHVNWENV